MDGGQLSPGFGARMRAARLAAGYKRQRDAALALGVTRQASVSAWETGITPPDLGVLRLLADHFANADEWFRWLREGGEMPRAQRRGPYTARTGEARPERAAERAQRALVAEAEQVLLNGGRRLLTAEEVLGWLYRMLRAGEAAEPSPPPVPPRASGAPEDR